MSEHVFQHYRTSTFAAAAAGITPPPVLRWQRDGHMVHLSLPAVPQVAAGTLITVGPLPAWIRPSHRAIAPMGDGVVELDAAANTLTFLAADRGGTIHYLAIPGQAEDDGGVLQRFDVPHTQEG